MDSSSRWWDDFKLAESEAGHWCIGPFELWARRSPGAWIFARRSIEDEAAASVDVEIPAPSGDFPEGREGWEHSRFGFSRSRAEARLRPMLPDRSLVVKPEMPLVLPAGEDVTFYVGLPLWISFEQGPERTELWQAPLVRPSDTWFGSLTGQGELCYAARTRAIFDRKNLLPRPNRAVGQIHVRNRASGPLPMDGLKLPLQNMSLFICGDGLLWTETVTLQRDDEDEMAALRFSEGPPSDLKNPVLVSPPRTTPSKGILVRAFDGLLSIRGGIDGIRHHRSRGSGVIDP